MSMESIVRPFSLPFFKPKDTTSKRAQRSSELVEITWGGSGADIFDSAGSALNSFKVEDEKQQRETRRTYDVVRVKNTEDDSQYVDTEVTTEYQMRQRITADRYTPFKYVYGAAPTGDNIEILKKGLVRTSRV